MSLTKLSVYLGVTSFFGFACGGDSGSNGANGSVDSGVDDSKPLSMLSSAELEQIGDSYANAAQGERLVDATCKFAAVLTSSFGASDPAAAPTSAQVDACNDAYADCKSQSRGTATAPMGAASVPTTSAAFAGCDVTVGQYETCLTESLEQLIQLFGSLSCNAPGMLQASAEVTPSAACAELSTECSGAFGDE